MFQSIESIVGVGAHKILNIKKFGFIAVETKTTTHVYCRRYYTDDYCCEDIVVYVTRILWSFFIALEIDCTGDVSIEMAHFIACSLLCVAAETLLCVV